MWSQVSGGQVVRVISHPVSLRIGDIQYPKNIFDIWSNSELKAIGIFPYKEIPVDIKYHNSGSISYEIKESEVIGSYPSFTDKDVAVLKTEMIERTKIRVSAFLSRDDWMVIREAEGGSAIPDNLKAYRTALRKESNDKETEIKALSNLDSIKLYEATPYIETRKDEDDKNYESEKNLNLVTYYFSKEDDPLKDDPSFVSLVKK